jgi:hypothetical protein
VVWVEGDVEDDIAAVTRFEAALGLAAGYDPASHGTVQGALSRIEQLMAEV